METNYFIHQSLYFIVSLSLLSKTLTLSHSSLHMKNRVILYGHQEKELQPSFSKEHILVASHASNVKQKSPNFITHFGKHQLKNVGLNYGWYSRPLYRRRPNSKFRKLDTDEITGAIAKKHNHVHSFWRDIEMDNTSLNADFDDFMKTVATSRVARDVSDQTVENPTKAETSHFDPSIPNQNLQSNFSRKQNPVQLVEEKRNRSKPRLVFYLKLPKKVHRITHDEKEPKFSDSFIIRQTNPDDENEKVISNQRTLPLEEGILAYGSLESSQGDISDANLNETLHNTASKSIGHQIRNESLNEIINQFKFNATKTKILQFKHKNIHSENNQLENSTNLVPEIKKTDLSKTKTISKSEMSVPTLTKAAGNVTRGDVSNSFKKKSVKKYSASYHLDDILGSRRNKSRNISQDQNKLTYGVKNRAASVAVSNHTAIKFKPLNYSLVNMKNRPDKLLDNRVNVSFAITSGDGKISNSPILFQEKIDNPGFESFLHNVSLQNFESKPVQKNFIEAKPVAGSGLIVNGASQKFATIDDPLQGKCNLSHKIKTNTRRFRNLKSKGISRSSKKFPAIFPRKRPEIREKLRREFTFADIFCKVNQDFRSINDKQMEDTKARNDERTKIKTVYSSNGGDFYPSINTKKVAETEFSHADRFSSNYHKEPIATINRIGQVEAEIHDSRETERSKFHGPFVDKCACNNRGLLGSTEGFQILVAVGELFSRKFLFPSRSSHAFPFEQEKRRRLNFFDRNGLSEMKFISREDNRKKKLAARINAVEKKLVTGKHKAFEKTKENPISYAAELDKETLENRAVPPNSLNSGVMKSEEVPLFRLGNHAKKPASKVENGNAAAAGLIISVRKNFPGLKGENGNLMNTKNSTRSTRNSEVPKVETRSSNGRAMRSNSFTSLARNAKASSEMQFDPLLEPESQHPQQNGGSYARLVLGKNSHIKQPERNANAGMMENVRIMESPLFDRLSYSSNVGNNGMMSMMETSLTESFQKFFEENSNLIYTMKKEGPNTLDQYLSMLSSPTEDFDLSTGKLLYFKQLNEKMKTALFVFEFWLLSSLGNSENIASFNNVWYSLDVRHDGPVGKTQRTQSHSLASQSSGDAGEECDCSAATLGTIAGFSTLTTLLGYALSSASSSGVPSTGTL